MTQFDDDYNEHMTKDYDDDHKWKNQWTGDDDGDREKAGDDLDTGGYSKMMESVTNVKAKTFDVFYKLYCKDSGKTKHQVNEEMVEIGLKDYNKEVGVKCKDVNALYKDIVAEIPAFTYNDAISALLDRGLMCILERDYDVSNAYDFLEQQGVDCPDN